MTWYLISLLIAYATAAAVTSDPFECIEQFKSFNFDPACVRLIISKILGFGIVFGSAIVKLPQLIKIATAKSAEGISSASLYFEVLTFTLTSSYAMHRAQPISTYGENVLILIQVIIMTIQLWYYQKVSVSSATTYATIYIVFVACPLISGMLPEVAWESIGYCQAGLCFLVKAPQIYTTFANGNTGQLSVITNFLNFAGVLARIFTILTEVDDVLQLINFGSACLLNGIILAQFAWYWNAPTKEKLK